MRSEFYKLNREELAELVEKKLKASPLPYVDKFHVLQHYFQDKSQVSSKIAKKRTNKLLIPKSVLINGAPRAREMLENKYNTTNISRTQVYSVLANSLDLTIDQIDKANEQYGYVISAVAN